MLRLTDLGRSCVLNRRRRADSEPKTFNVLVIAADPLIADYWSMTAILDDLRVLYQSLRGLSGRDMARCLRSLADATRCPDTDTDTNDQVIQSLPPITLEYITYTHFRLNQLAGDEGRALWRFWENELAGTDSNSRVAVLLMR